MRPIAQRGWLSIALLLDRANPFEDFVELVGIKEGTLVVIDGLLEGISLGGAVVTKERDELSALVGSAENEKLGPTLGDELRSLEGAELLMGASLGDPLGAELDDNKGFLLGDSDALLEGISLGGAIVLGPPLGLADGDELGLVELGAEL
jgi:hypothetical protein